MTYPAPAQGLWRSARQLPSRTPLRVKLIAAVLALVTVALVVISIAGIAFLRGYLLNQADQELASTARYGQIPLRVQTFLAGGETQPSNGGISVQWLPKSGPLQQAVAEFAGSAWAWKAGWSLGPPSTMTHHGSPGPGRYLRPGHRELSIWSSALAGDQHGRL